MNTVNLIGNLTRDPELRHTKSGTPVADLGLAVNERYKSGDDWHERAHFFQITVWGRQAETAAEYLSKGRQVGITGRLQYDSWEHEGQKRSKVFVVADRVEFLGGGGGGGGNGGSREFDPAVAESDVPADTAGLPSAGGGGAVPAAADDDIPFRRPPEPGYFDERERRNTRGAYGASSLV